MERSIYCCKHITFVYVIRNSFEAQFSFRSNRNILPGFLSQHDIIHMSDCRRNTAAGQRGTRLTLVRGNNATLWSFLERQFHPRKSHVEKLNYRRARDWFACIMPQMQCSLGNWLSIFIWPYLNFSHKQPARGKCVNSGMTPTMLFSSYQLDSIKQLLQ